MQTSHLVVVLSQMSQTKEMRIQSDETVSSSVHGKNEVVFTRERFHFATVHDQRTFVHVHHAGAGCRTMNRTFERTGLQKIFNVTYSLSN